MATDSTTTKETTDEGSANFRSSLAERTAALRLQADSRETVCKVTAVRYAVNNSHGMIDEDYWFDIPSCVVEVDTPGGSKYLSIDLRADWLETGLMQVLHSVDAVDDDGRVHAEALTGERIAIEPRSDDKHRVYISPPGVEQAATDTVIFADKPMTLEANMHPEEGLNDALTQLYHQYRDGDTNWWKTQIKTADPSGETTLEVVCETVTGEELTWEYNVPDFQWDDDNPYMRLIEELGGGDYEGLEDEYIYIRQWFHVHPPDVDCLKRSTDGSWVMALPDDVERVVTPSTPREHAAAAVNRVRDRLSKLFDTSTPDARIH